MKKNNSIPIAIVIAAAILAVAITFNSSGKREANNTSQAIKTQTEEYAPSDLEKSVIPASGVVLPISWKDLGLRLAMTGTIDVIKLKALYEARGGIPKELEKMLLYESGEKIIINEKNAPFLLNLFWALGLGNKNEILEKGEMSEARYGGPSAFASTAGWTIANGDPMSHYSMHGFISLIPEEQALVERMSRGIYRPCCDNSTHFPDCNHGMAMLGLLELMASQNVSEADMWKAALAVNSYWFPAAYMDIATYLEARGISWNEAPAKEILGKSFSSASGYSNISAKLINDGENGNNGSGNAGAPSCGVDFGAARPKVSSQPGCGV